MGKLVKLPLPPRHDPRKLGKLPPRHDPRTLQFARYLRALPTPPPSRVWSAKSSPDWGMMRNDALGDCTCAAAGHLIQCWTANASAEVTPGDDAIVDAYRGSCGYDPSDPSTDRGGVELDVLNYWRQTGIGGWQIAAYVALEPRNRDHVKAAIDLFGGIYTGFALPLSAQSQDVWSVVGGVDAIQGSWGGHAVAVVDYDELGVTCVTWGALKRMTWGFVDTYMDEAYAVLSAAWLSTAAMAPNGFVLPQLVADLQELT